MQIELPQDKEAEAMVLGCALRFHDHVSVMCDSLNIDDFFFPDHRLIFGAIKRLYDKKSSVDRYLVKSILDADGKLNEIGGLNYLIKIFDGVGISTCIEEYCAIVREKSMRRRVIELGNSMIIDAANEKNHFDEILDAYEKSMIGISESSTKTSNSSMRQFLLGEDSPDGKNFLDVVRERQEEFKKNGGVPILRGISTGFDKLDKKTNGLMKSNLIIIGARPGVGKSTFAMNLALNAMMKNHVKVGIFSLEMTKDQLTNRALSFTSELNYRCFEDGSISDHDFNQKLVPAYNKCLNLPFEINDQFKLKSSEVRRISRKWVNQQGIELIIVDYIQYVTANTTMKFENRQVVVSEISKNLKGLSRELNIPIVCCAQLNRESVSANQNEEKPSRKPTLSDLRESGALEQDADIVILLHRLDYNDPLNKPGKCDVIVAKNRHGEIGTVTMDFNKIHQKFVESTDVDGMTPDYSQLRISFE